ncbi:MAG: ATP-dependent DNA helicase RecG [Lachnospiraceae bacterium]|nr:ATP-dependent DNA helicase RecG [Lachnospiraceae bacterium]
MTGDITKNSPPGGASPLTELKGIGEKTAKAFEKMGIRTTRDLLLHYPRGYDFLTPVKRVSETAAGEICAVCLIIVGQGASVRAKGRSITHFKAADETGEVRLTYFNMPYLRSSLKPRTVHVFRGIMKVSARGLRYMEQPHIYSEESYEALSGTLQPRYPLTAGISNKTVSGSIKKILTKDYEEPDYLKPDELQSLSLIPSADATRKIHFPESEADIRAARDRKVFDEFFFFIYALKSEKEKVRTVVNRDPLIEVAETQRLIESLPYELTPDQKTAWEDIRTDLCSDRVMNRLLQGDVGSGKTILAFLALIMCAVCGRQGALMAPTEVLARQHMEDLTKLLQAHQLPLRPVLLTGSLPAAEKRAARAMIAAGEADIVIGTHALIQEGVSFVRLGLVITDEQHRFGVRQRESLAGKGEEVPVLVMSATPIPRTLAIILYGDLDISILKTMPAMRLPIKNLALAQSQREKAFRFLQKRIEAGEQVYIICPSIEEGELADVVNVSDYAQALKDVLPASVRIETLTGRMKAAEKTRVMTSFSEHRTDVLVSTTVVEVGINVPNATLIMIENAERFGLSQLHQLRGRVGRGNLQSFCIFLYNDADGRQKPKRLEILEKTNDGFVIAEEDLKLRGPGDFFGVRQSGELGFVLADIYEDADVLKKAAACAERHLKAGDSPDPALGKAVDFRSI